MDARACCIFTRHAIAKNVDRDPVTNAIVNLRTKL